MSKRRKRRTRKQRRRDMQKHSKESGGMCMWHIKVEYINSYGLGTIIQDNFTLKLPSDLCLLYTSDAADE